MSKRQPYPQVEAIPGMPVYWASLEERAATPEQEAKIAAERAQEFPEGASELIDPVSRRSFMSLMSAGIALGALEACRRPVEHIVPYNQLPENVIPGVPAHYATVAEIRGEAIGLLVESHEGRPTKIEGNPEHPSSQGAVDLQGQASVLDLYDPDRARTPTEGAHARTWAEFDAAFSARMAMYAPTGGQGLHVLTSVTRSPTFLRMRDAVLARFPNARFHTHDTAIGGSSITAARVAFGTPLRPVYEFDRARVVVSLDCDFLQTEAGAVRNARAFADSRRVRSGRDSMSRLYQIESTHTTTGANADHRLRLPVRDIEASGRALALRLATAHQLDMGDVTAALQGVTPPAGVPAHWIQAVAADLVANRGQSLVVVGARQPAELHALAHMLNEALGNAGRTVRYSLPIDPGATDPVEDLRGLAQAMETGQVQTLVILGVNPAYDSPGDLGFAAKLARVPVSFHLSLVHDETSQHCTWHAPTTHFLEAWGDAISSTGVLAIQQPLVAPLFGSRSEIELLAQMADLPVRTGHELVRQGRRGPLGADEHAFEREWRRALHSGIANSPMPGMVVAGVRRTDVAAAIRTRALPTTPISRTNLEVVFQPDPKRFDGRHANNAWLAELPDPMTRIVWDNVAQVSPTTARELGLHGGELVELNKDGRSIRVAAWITPGQADGSITLNLGWGRTHAGRIGDAHGFDVNPLRSSQSPFALEGVALRMAGETHRVVQTQEHHRMENRPLALEATLDEYREQPRFAQHQSPTPRTLPLWREVQYEGHKWGMVVDLNACTGCNACVIACQSENNIPVVGKDQVSRGREMHWIRVDRYFVGDENDPQVASQPVACVQCEEAPCENVCPVNATAHTPEGLNDMAYNRCIGTRYCSNNCPYKVRRFNYLNWHNDGPYQPGDPDVPETVQMQHNPNVTVRFRGVMEKCTYCVQRIQTAKISAKRDNRPLRPDEITVACQQSCPSQAITFGDLNDDRSRVHALARNERGYKLLAEIGTQPRTSYLAKIRNPNPEMHG